MHAPGFLQFFETGPFTLADVKDGKLEIDVPRPATLDVSFEPGDQPAANLPFNGAWLEVDAATPREQLPAIASVSEASTTPKLKLADLAPGHYLVTIRTQPKEEIKALPGTEINVGAYFDQRQPTLTAGQSRAH